MLSRLVEAFFNPKGPFAATTFDDLGSNPPEQFVESDLVAVTLLDVRFSPPPVRRLLSGEFDERLSNIDDETALWEANEETLKAADELFEALDELPGVGETKASKLLSRKRPHLIPINDSVINAALELERKLRPLTGDYWSVLGAVLSEERNTLAKRINELRPETAPDASTLRLLDVALWMKNAENKNIEKLGIRP